MAEDHNFLTPGAEISWPPLLPEEKLQWEGRPAPRCYTFRQWRHALFGLFLTTVCSVWLWLGVQQAAEQGWPWLVWVPLPFLGYALWLAFGQLLVARLEWAKVAYAVTDRRIIVQHGLFKPCLTALELERLTWFRLQPLARSLAPCASTVKQVIRCWYCTASNIRAARLNCWKQRSSQYKRMDKTFYLETFGCQMNVVDSERIVDLLGGIGYLRVAEAQAAQLLLLNTCAVRDKAVRKAYGHLGRFKPLKDADPSLIIGLGGCVAQQEGENCCASFPTSTWCSAPTMSIACRNWSTRSKGAAARRRPSTFSTGRRACSCFRTASAARR